MWWYIYTIRSQLQIEKQRRLSELENLEKELIENMEKLLH